MKVVVLGFLSIFILSGCMTNPRDSVLYGLLDEPKLKDCIYLPALDQSDCERRVNSSKSSMSDEYEEDRTIIIGDSIPKKNVDEFLKKKFPKSN